MTAFIIIISIIIIERFIELIISKRNEKWLISQGAVEYGREHYKLFIYLHTAFIISLITEFFLTNKSNYSVILPVIFFILQIFRFLIITNLGKRWNTKILIIPGLKPVDTGIYRYIKHPNYIIVILEFIIIPWIFYLFYTAVFFSVLNLLLLSIRIKTEHKALYGENYFNTK